MIYKQLIRKYKSLLKKKDKINNEIRELLKQVEDCEHEITYNSSQERDNGYGKWWTVYYETCIICNKSRYSYYDDMSDPSEWREKGE